MTNKIKQYDVIVVGGGTAGCAAAYTAGKLGLKTLLVEKNIHLGGTITSALVVPAMNSAASQINSDFYEKLIAELHTMGGQITYENNPGWFNPELCKVALDRLMLNLVRLKDTQYDLNFLRQLCQQIFSKFYHIFYQH